MLGGKGQNNQKGKFCSILKCWEENQIKESIKSTFWK